MGTSTAACPTLRCHAAARGVVPYISRPSVLLHQSSACGCERPSPVCRGSAEHLATVLRASLAAGQAAGTLVDAVGLHSGRLLAAMRGLVELLPWEPGRRAALCALACRSGALNRLVDLLRVCHSPYCLLPRIHIFSTEGDTHVPMLGTLSNSWTPSWFCIDRR